MSPLHRARAVPRSLALPALLLLATMLAPGALAQAPTMSLDDFEEPQTGEERTWKFTVDADEAGSTRAVVFRNVPGNSFGLLLLDNGGNTRFERNGSRGIQTLPALAEGQYTFFVRFREGTFQVVEHAFGVTTNDSVSANLTGTTDAYVVTASKHYDVTITGDVDVEWFDLRIVAPETLETPVTRATAAGAPYVITLRGADGTPYAIQLAERASAPSPPSQPTEETPAPGPILALGVLLVLALALRRRRRG